MARQKTWADMNSIRAVDGGGSGSIGPSSSIARLTEDGSHQHCLSLPPLSRSGYDFKAPVDIQTIAGSDAFLPKLIGTRAFQRLKDVRFLGGIDYCLVPRPNGSQMATRYTRQQHSLGVLRLAHLYCEKRQVNGKERQLICAAALLHDIGHPPLSHSMEPVFKDCFGLEHHKATEDIILGRVPLGKEVFDVLRSHNVDAEKVVALIAEENGAIEGFFHGPINFDTMEGISRSYRYLHPRRAIPSPEDIALSALNRKVEEDRETVDQFWMRKGEVYSQLIGSRKGILADLACQAHLRSHVKRIGIEDYFGTERNIFRKLPGLRELLASPLMEQKVTELVSRPISHTSRTYYIDHSSDFFHWEDSARYRHNKHICKLSLKGESLKAAEEGK